MISRKLNIEAKYTDLYKETLGKSFKVKTDHKTMLILNEILTKPNTKGDTESKDEKTLKLLLGESAWKEVKEFLETNENYAGNLEIAVLDVMAIAHNWTFEETVRRFQRNRD